MVAKPDEGATHVDAALAPNIHDAAYLESRIEAGEGFEFYYASDGDRTAQTRTPITDGAYSEPWVFRPKDLRNFWARAHRNRPGSVRAGADTAWVAQSKPIWLIELGCPAVDKGANAPNLFIDAQSSESALPPFSTGARDDLIQRRTLEAYLKHWDIEDGVNPISSVDGRAMIAETFLWAWDARPHPAFPARTDVWRDGDSWRRGHWLNGRAGLSGLAEVVADLCLRGGVSNANVAALRGAVGGYVIDAPSSARASLEPLMAAFDFTAAERDGALCLFHADDNEPVLVSVADFSAASAGARFAERNDPADAPSEARLRFIDPARDYLIAGVSARRLDRAEGGVETIEAPLVLETDAAEQIAQRVLADRRASVESLRIELGPAHLTLEPGDRLTLGDGDVFEITRIEATEVRALDLRRARSSDFAMLATPEPSAPQAPPLASSPALSILDLPPLPGAEDDERPLVAVFASPWVGAHDLYAGATQAEATHRARISSSASVGELLWALYPGPVDRWDHGNVTRIKLYGGALASVTEAALLSGANALAIENDGEWEIVQVRDAVLVGVGEYELRGLLRGQLGSEHAMASPHPIGARVVVLDARLGRFDLAAHEWNEAMLFVAPPAGALVSDARAALITRTLPHAARRAWAPAHLKARRLSTGAVQISWIRQVRKGGDAWGPGDPALDAPAESYQLDILDGALVKRSATVSTPSYLYSAADQSADFGGFPASLRLRVAQWGANGALGLNKELTILL